MNKIKKFYIDHAEEVTITVMGSSCLALFAIVVYQATRIQVMEQELVHKGQPVVFTEEFFKTGIQTLSSEEPIF